MVAQFDVFDFLLLVSILEAQESSRGGRSGFYEARENNKQKKNHKDRRQTLKLEKASDSLKQTENKKTRTERNSHNIFENTGINNIHTQYNPKNDL